MIEILQEKDKRVLEKPEAKKTSMASQEDELAGGQELGESCRLASEPSEALGKASSYLTYVRRHQEALL